MRGGVALALVALASCAPAAPRATATPSPPAPVFRPMPLPPARAAVARLFQARDIGRSGVRVLPAEPGVERYVFEGFRVEDRGGELRASELALAENVVAALPSASGWRLVTPHEVWEATEFVGAPRRVMATRAGRMGRGTGRVVVIRDGTLEGAEFSGRGRVIDAAFGDDARGVLVVEPGVAYATEDGGASWRRVARGDAAAEVIAAGDTRWVLGATGATTLDASGTETAALPDEAPRVEDAATQRYQMHGAWDHGRPAVERAEPFSRDGTRFLIPGRHDEPPRTYDTVDDRFEPVEIGTPPCDEFEPILDERFGVCPVASEAPDEPDRIDERGETGAGSRERSLQLFERDASGAWQQRFTFTPCFETGGVGCAASDDGLRVACEGACGTRGDACAVASVVCERVGDAPARETRLGDPFHAWRLLGIDGGEPLLVDAHARLDRVRMRRGDVEGPLVASAPETGMRLVPRSVQLGADGALRFFAAVAGEPRLRGVEGRPGGAFAWVPDPPDARSQPVDGGESGIAGAAAFRYCGDIAFAQDRAGNSLVRSAAGQWVALGSLADDPDAAAALDVPRDERSGLNCERGALGVYGRFQVLGRGPVRMSRYSGLGVMVPTREQPPRTASAWRCSVEQRRPAPRREEHRLPARYFSGSPQHGTQDGQRVTLDVPWDTPASRGDDTQHAYLFSEADVSARYQDHPHYAVLDVRPDYALLLLEDERSDRPLRAELLRLRPAAAPQSLATYETARPSVYEGFTGTLIARDGGRVAAFSGVGGRTLVAFADAGGRGTLTFVALAPSVTSRERRCDTRGVFVLGDEAGTVRWSDGGDVVVTPLGGEPRSLGVRGGSAPCGPAARGDFAFATQVEFDTDGRGDWPRATAAHYGVDGGAMCFRGLQNVDGPLWSAGPDGDALRGSVRLEASIAGVRCEPLAVASAGEPGT